jgi:hypothetical protein
VFVDAVTDKAASPTPQASEWTLCATCQHQKRAHCTAYKAGKAARLKPGEMAYRILRDANGTAYACRHFSQTDDKCQCNSTGCSATDDGREFCACRKFANPWLTPKSQPATTKKRNRKAVVASLVVAATDSTPETVPAKPRGFRKKKTTAFTTGESLFPPETTAAPRTE